MNATTPLPPASAGAPSMPTEFTECFERQRGEFLSHPCPGYGERVADLRAMHRLLVENRAALVDAVNRDYGNRSTFETLFAELLLNQEGILDAIKHLKAWMKPLKRRLDVTLPGGDLRYTGDGAEEAEVTGTYRGETVSS